METKECQFCLTQIAAKAKKCRFCLEWQDVEVQMNEVPDNMQVNLSISSPFQLRWLKFTNLPYYISTLIFTTIAFSIVQLVFLINDEQNIYLLSVLTFALQMYCAWAGLIWVYKIIEIYKVDISRVISIDSQNIESNKVAFSRIFAPRAIISGILVGLIAAVGDYINGTPFFHESTKIVFAIFEFTNMFFAGAAIFTMLMFGLFISKVTKLEDKLSTVNPSDIKQFYDIGSIHLKTSVLAIIPLFLGVIAKLFGEWSWDLIVIIWYTAFAILIIIYVFLPMTHIHNIMLMFKTRQADIVANSIQSLQRSIEYEPTHRNMERLYQLRRVEKDVGDLKTWPFSTKSLSVVFFAVIFPLIMLIIDKLLK